MILFKKLYRTIFKYKAQFISMIILIFLGAGIFMGFNGEWKSLQNNGYRYFEETNLADYIVYNDTGFTYEELERINGIENVNASLRANLDVSYNEKKLNLNAVSHYGISSLYIASGESYSSKAFGIYLSDKFASENKLSLNDSLTLSYNGKSLSLPIVSLIKCPEYIYCVEDENQIMPDYLNYGYGFVSPSTLAMLVDDICYNQIIIDSDLDSKDINTIISEKLGYKALIVEQESFAGVAMLESEISEGKTMGNLLPVVFLAIALLTLITTMHRITTNEKTQIGILKALGFRNGKILRHYSYLGSITGLIGAIFSIPVGYLVAKMIVNPDEFEGTCFDMPYWNISMPWWIYIILIITVLIVTKIAFVSTRKILKGTASDALKSYTPKKVNNLLIEKTALWKHFSFSTRWNLRDLVRKKSKTIMGIIGVLGAMILLVASLGMKDTMNEFIDVMDTKLFNFNYKVTLSDSKKENIKLLNDNYDIDMVYQAAISLDDDNYTLEIYENDNDYIRVIDTNNNIVKMEAGVYVGERIATEHKLKVGDRISFTIYGTAIKVEVPISKIVKSSFASAIYMRYDYAKTLKINNIELTDIASLSYILTNVNINKTEYSFINTIKTKKDVIDTYDSMLEIMNFMIVILVVFAILLGFVVLYNLGAISYVEKYRDLATLKVVGFDSKRIGGLLIKQNIWITIIGIILGIPFGYLLLAYCVKELAADYELTVSVSIWSYLISIALTIIVSLVVNILINRNNKKINMVEALKIAD